MKALKVLLDENLPDTLRHHLTHHETMTAAYAGFAGHKNGALLDAAEAGKVGPRSFGALQRASECHQPPDGSLTFQAQGRIARFR